MKNILTAASLGAFIMFFACAPEASERLTAVVNCMEDPVVQLKVEHKVQLEDEYNKEVDATYKRLLKEGHGRVQAKKSAEAIWFDMSQEVSQAKEQADNAVRDCAKAQYNIDL